MAKVAAIRIRDITEFAIGSDTYPGIQSMDVTLNDGDIIYVRETGDLLVTVQERGQSDQPPVVADFETQDIGQILVLRNLPESTVTVKGKVIGSATAKVITFTRGIFRQLTGRMGIQPGRVNSATRMQLSCVSSDGAALPITIADDS